MRLHLKFIERYGINFLLGNIQKASLSQWKAINEMKNILTFKPEEIKKFNVRQDGKGGMTYDKTHVEESVEYTLPDTGFAFLRAMIAELDSANAVHIDLISLAEKILGQQEEQLKQDEKAKPKQKKK